MPATTNLLGMAKRMGTLPKWSWRRAVAVSVEAATTPLICLVWVMLGFSFSLFIGSVHVPKLPVHCQSTINEWLCNIYIYIYIYTYIYIHIYTHYSVYTYLHPFFTTTFIIYISMSKV